MKKQVKIMSAILIAITLIASLTTAAFADSNDSTASTNDPTASSNNSTSIINKMKSDGSVDTSSVQSFGQNIATIIRVVGTIAAVVIVLILGIKYMMGSAEQKAEYKKTMIPYLVGAVLLFAASTIVGFIYDSASKF